MLNPHLHLNPDWSKSAKKSTRDGFSDALVELGQKHQDIVVLTADLAESTKTDAFKKAYPDRFFDVGVAEQNMMSMGAGMAAAGLIPFVCSYAIFSPGRNWEQLRNTVCYSRLNVKIASTHSGISVGPDGATHQALEDIALTRSIPHLSVVCPCDAEQARQATLALASFKGPAYLRLSRYASPQITTGHTLFEFGQAQTLCYGEKITVVATGIMVPEALRAAEVIDAEVINIHTIKPLDIGTIVQSVNKTGKLIVIEEHQTAGGLGSAVLEAYIQKGLPLPPVKLIGINDRFGQSGSAEQLLQAYGLTWEHIVDQAREF